MPISARSFVLVVFAPLAGCLDTQPPSQPPVAHVAQPPPSAPPAPRDDAFCDHRLYRCRPNDLSAKSICDYACLFPAHCQDYGPGDYQYCATHPDSFDRRGRYCDPWGNPDWNTYCVAGPLP
jgi:hypothetical protein